VSDRDNRKNKKQLQAINEEKVQLENKIKELKGRENKKEGCCSSCVVM
jgi:hypothetical protein